MVNWGNFDSQVRSNVFEIKFIRRIPKAGYSKTRRMLCTRSKEILDDDWGRKFQHYVVPSGQLPYNPREKNLVIVWDFMRQDWRAVPCESCQIITKIPVDTDENLGKFYIYWFDFVRRLGGGKLFKNWMDM
jgi:hypothetical protein